MTTPFTFTSTREIKKTDAQRGVVYVEIYVPMALDSQGDFMTAESIEKMAHDFNISGRADAVDEEHNGRKSGSLIVESFIAQPGSEFTPGSWVGGLKPDPITMAKIDRDEIIGVSFQGTAGEIVPTVLDGKNVRELRGVVAKAVSWTARPANRLQGAKMIVKNDSLGEALAAIKALTERFDELRATAAAVAERAERVSNPGASRASVAKSAAVAKAEAEREIEAQQVRKMMAVLQQKLEDLFERPTHDAARRERWLLDEIAKCEVSLATLSPELSIFETPANSAFRFRGGTSFTSDAPGVASDSAMVRRDVKKADELNLDALAIGLRHRGR